MRSLSKINPQCAQKRAALAVSGINPPDAPVKGAFFNVGRAFDFFFGRMAGRERAFHAWALTTFPDCACRSGLGVMFRQEPPENVTLMSRERGSLQRSLLELISSNGQLDMFELTALAYELEPDDQGKIVITAAHVASVRRALVVLFREELAIGSTARRAGRCALTVRAYPGRPWFWIEPDDSEGREPLDWEG